MQRSIRTLQLWYINFEMNSDTLLIVRNTIFLVNKMTTALFIIKLSIVLFIDKYTTDE